MSGYLAAIGAKEIEPLELVDRVVQAAVEVREGPEALRRAIWRDESGAEVWVHLEGEAPHTTTVIFRGTGRVTGLLGGVSQPVDGPQNGHVMIVAPEPALAEQLVLDLAEYGDAAPGLCAGRRVSVGVAALLTEGQVFRNRAAYLVACSRRGEEKPSVPMQPVGVRLQGDTPNATLGGTIAGVEERRNSLSGESFLALTVEWEDQSLEVAAHAADLQGDPPGEGSYLAARVWLVGFDLSYASAVPADPAQFPLQPGAVAAFTGWNGYLQLLQVTRLEPLAPENLVVHIRVFGELFDSMEALQAHGDQRQVAVSHLPLDAAALLDSQIMLLGSAALTDVDEAAHTTWRQAYDRGEAGIFGIPLDRVMDWLADTHSAEEEPADDLPDDDDELMREA